MAVTSDNQVSAYDSVVGFVNGCASVECLLGGSPNADARRVADASGACLSSQVNMNNHTSSVCVWYATYCDWFKHTYQDGRPATRALFARTVRSAFGLGSRPNGRRALGVDGRRNVQYRVFCYNPKDARSQVNEARDKGLVGFDALSQRNNNMSMVFGNRDYLDYDARKRTIEDFFHFAQGRDVSMTEALSRIFLDRASRYDLGKSLRMWDWFIEYANGGIGWRKRKLPQGRYIIEMTAPAKGLPIPPANGVDLSDESFLRFSFLVRDGSDAHPDMVDWDEEIADGMIFGRHCLLSVGVTLIEPCVNPIDGSRHMREIYVDNPGMFEMSPTGFSFDSDTLLAILGSQDAVKRCLVEMESNTVECADGKTGHSSASHWLDGEPHTSQSMVFEQRVACYNGVFSPCGKAYGRFGNLMTNDIVGSDGAYQAKRQITYSDAYDSYEGYILGDEFSGETGEREKEYTYDTSNPREYTKPMVATSSIPMSNFSLYNR